MVLREAAILVAALISGGRMVHIEGGRLGGSEAVVDQLLGTQGGKDGVISILPYLYISWKKMRHYLLQSWTLSARSSCGDGAFVFRILGKLSFASFRPGRLMYRAVVWKTRLAESR